MARTKGTGAPAWVPSVGAASRVVLAACSLGGSGHLQPLLPLLDAARAAGSRDPRGGSAGDRRPGGGVSHPFAAGGEPPEAAVAPIREQLTVAPAHEASVLGNRDLFGRLAATAMLPAMGRLVDEWRPDLVLRDPCEYASAVVAQAAGVATAQVAIGLAGVEWGSIEVAAPALEEHRPGLADELRRSRVPVAVPGVSRPVAVSRHPTLPGTAGVPTAGAARLVARFPGAARLRQLRHRARPHGAGGRGVRDRPGRGRRAGRPRPPHRRSSVRSRAPDDVPAHVHVEAWVDQADVLGTAELVVCHGGSGTTFGALAAGVPVVIVPMFADQFTNGDRVAAAGAGAVVHRDPLGAGRRPLGLGDAPHVADAIETVRSDPSYAAAAGRIAGEMASVPPVDTLLDDLLANASTTPSTPREGYDWGR